MRRILPLLLALVAPAAIAQDLMTPEAFEAWSTGRTLDYYFADGTFWGSERHLDGRRTLDADADTGADSGAGSGGATDETALMSCREGRWFAEGTAICFVYDGYDGTHCWQFWQDGDVVTALNVTAAPEDLPFTVRTSDRALDCLGPEVGT